MKRQREVRLNGMFLNPSKYVYMFICTLAFSINVNINLIFSVNVNINLIKLEGQLSNQTSKNLF